MPTTIERYVCAAKVLSVFEHLEDGPSIKDQEGTWVAGPKISRGWYVRIDGSSAICVGKEKPPFVVGENINLILERKVVSP